MPQNRPSGYDFSAFRRGALSSDTGPSLAATIAAAEANKKRPRGSASIQTATKPRGALTHMAGNVVRAASRALGSSERDAEQRGAAFEQFNRDWNPLSQADMVGTQLRRAADGDRDFDRGALAEGAVGTALSVAPEIAAPAVRALAKTKAGKKVIGALSHSTPIVEDTAVEGTARAVSSTRKRATADVRTKDGAVVTPAPEKPKGALATPDEAAVPVRHYSHTRNLTEADPSSMGSNPRKNMGRDERSQMKRVYLGENRGALSDYDKTKDVGIGPFSYDGSIPERKIVDVGSPMHEQFKNQASYVMDRPELMQAWGLSRHAGPQKVVETLQKEAGFPVRRFGDEYTPYGATLHSFEPVPLTRTPEVPLEGQPLKLDANGPHQDLRDTARGYMSDAKKAYSPNEQYLQVDPDRAAAIGKAYEDMPHAPNDPEVQKAYGALAKETLDQYAALKRDGYSFGFYPRDEAGSIVDPYPSPFDALRDIRGDAKHMKVYPTDDGYGAAGITDDMIAENPMLAAVPGETWGDQPVRVNDVFRAVHDAFGHAKDGVGFRAAGEENAWASHRAMYSPEAQRAMTTETRGQNSWLNYGPHGEANRTASTADTVFAPQKIGLMPDWTLDPNGMPPQPRVRPAGSAAPLNEQTDRIIGALENSPRMRAARGEQVTAPEAPGTTPDGRAIWPREREGEDTASAVLSQAAQPKKASDTFSAWRAEHDQGDGDLFDYSRLSEVPDVPQTPIERYDPPRGPSDRIVDALARTDVEDGINDRVHAGMSRGGPEWYNTEPLRQSFLEAHGPEEGQARYGRFMDAVAATSPRSTVQDNIRTASLYNYRVENGQPVNAPTPRGYGSIAQGLHQSNMLKLTEGGGWDVMANPKPASFSANLQGNQHVSTIDTHNFRLPGVLSGDPRFLATTFNTPIEASSKREAADKLRESIPGIGKAAVTDFTDSLTKRGGDTYGTLRPRRWVEDGNVSMDQALDRPAFWDTKPRKNEYGYYEDWQREQADKMGLSPAQYQASMWVGGADDTGLASAPEPFLRTLEARVKYTADKMGLDPKQVLDLLVRGKSPLLSVAPAGALAAQQADEQR